MLKLRKPKTVPRQVRERFERFVDAEADSLYTLFRRCVGDAHTATDLYQDTLMRAWKKLDTYDASQPLRPWVFRIGQNLLRNHLRRGRLERKANAPLLDEPLAHSCTPLQSALARESDRLLEAAILGLPETQRVVVVLRYQEQLSCAEIARVLDTTANAVSIQLNRARGALRVVLRKSLMEGDR